MSGEIRIRLIHYLALLLACVPAGDLSARQDGHDQQRTRQAQAVGRVVYESIQDAVGFMDTEDYAGALRVLNTAYQRDRLTDYERSNLLNYIAAVQFNMGDAVAATASFEALLLIPALELQLRKQTLYTLAQLSRADDRHAAAIGYLESWFALEPNPEPEAYIVYAQILYGLDRYADMIAPIEEALRIASAADDAAAEDWYTLLNFAYFRQENFARVRDIQKVLLQRWPKKQYWLALAGAYTELGEEGNVAATYDIANTLGLLDEEAHWLTMAQLYLQHEVPYKAAVLLESRMARGDIARTAGNYRLLSQAWSLAQEDEKSLPALVEAARLSGDGDMNLRLGNTYLSLGRYAECANAIRTGQQKGNLAHPDSAQITLGMCLFHQGDYGAATAAFRNAAANARSAGIANQWLDVIDAAIARNDTIRQAEVAADARVRALAERRASRSGI